MWRRIATSLACLAVASTLAMAAETDARMRVDLPAMESGATADVGTLVAQALPILWDRLVPRTARAQADAIPADYRLMLRLKPGPRRTTVEFNPQVVFRTLAERQIPFIPAPPRLRLVVRVRNMAGMEMTETEAQLMAQAQTAADRWGIVLTDDAPALVLEWRWVTDRNVMLNARGTSRLPEFSETRALQGGDPLPDLVAWMEDVLLRARDAHAFAASGNAQATVAANGESSRVILTVRRDAPLAAQVALEEALAHDPRVHDLVPLELSRTRQRYAIETRDAAAWLPDWLARRGLGATQLPDGTWLAQ